MGTARELGQLSLFPLALELDGRRVLVVGGGAAASRHVPALLAAGAKVQIVSPRLTPALRAIVDAGRAAWHERSFRPGDVEGTWLVHTAVDDSETAALVSEAAEQQRVFCFRDDEGAGVLRAAPPAPGDFQGVALVGGGPGDPELITVLGRRMLDAADVVVADRLAPATLLGELRPEVEFIDASKIPYGPSMAQEEINRILIERAQQGKFVVRLKGGDPFVFGRGGEEVIACADAGVPVMVVPGVTSSIGVPALAGIPLTHRGVAQGFTVLSGSHAPDSPSSTADWSVAARLRGTLVILMGMKNLAVISEHLMAAGRAADTPAAVVQEGSTRYQRSVRGTLGTIAADVTAAGLRAPAIIVIGEVVNAVASGSAIAIR